MNTPSEVLEKYMGIGEAKAKMSFIPMFLLGIMAGAFIAFGGVASTFANVVTGVKLAGACVFPGGLAMVLLAGSELFTGNCLMVAPVLSKRIKVSGMLRNWIVVYLGNLVGGVAVAALVVYGHSVGAVAEAAIGTAAAKCSLGFGDAVFRGILCNVLVCVAVWISFAATDVSGKILGIFFPIMMFVLCGFEHCVANMYFVSAGMLASSLPEYAGIANITMGGFLLGNLLPVTIGNIIGGGLVGTVYWKCFHK